MKRFSSRARLNMLLPVLSVATLIVVVVAVSGTLLYMRGKSIMEQQLKDKLRSTAAAAAMQFDGETLDRIHTGDSVTSSPALLSTVQKLQSIRHDITNIRFAYIMRKTNDPALLEFVADADLALTDAELDRNDNGTVDTDEEASSPGDTYDWSEFPMLGDEAFLHATVDENIGTDQWGAIISGYAPIRRANGQVAGILGLDMDANEFVSLSNSIFSPIALLLVLLATICVTAGSAIFLWHRRVETLERLETERSGLLRLAFHQLGGPLTIINWSLEELEEDGPASIQRTIANIQEGVRRLGDILKMLKSADLVHAGKIDYNPELVSLDSILEGVARVSGTKLAVKKQRITLNLEKNILMRLDAKLIAGVAQELVQNATDFSPTNSTIAIRCSRHGKYAEFSVIDNGCGIPKKDLHRIFDEFTRGSNATTYKADGNGLGLYIVDGIVRQAGGTVTVQSLEGKGTTVTVKLPLA